MQWQLGGGPCRTSGAGQCQWQWQEGAFSAKPPNWNDSSSRCQGQDRVRDICRCVTMYKSLATRPGHTNCRRSSCNKKQEWVTGWHTNRLSGRFLVYLVTILLDLRFLVLGKVVNLVEITSYFSAAYYSVRIFATCDLHFMFIIFARKHFT
jgi:hypothetical protein